MKICLSFGTNGPLIIINKQSRLKESTERLAITKRCLNGINTTAVIDCVIAQLNSWSPCSIR